LNHSSSQFLLYFYFKYNRNTMLQKMLKYFFCQKNQYKKLSTVYVIFYVYHKESQYVGFPLEKESDILLLTCCKHGARVPVWDHEHNTVWRWSILDMQLKSLNWKYKRNYMYITSIQRMPNLGRPHQYGTKLMRR
jgi:hypothetical protein